MFTYGRFNPPHLGHTNPFPVTSQQEAYFEEMAFVSSVKNRSISKTLDHPRQSQVGGPSMETKF